SMPYRLYAISNVGSLLALLSYPFVFEPGLSRQRQALMWSYGLGAFAVLGGLCAWRLWKDQPGAASFSDTERDPPQTTVSTATKWLWVGLPGCASVLLLASSNK